MCWRPGRAGSMIPPSGNPHGQLKPRRRNLPDRSGHPPLYSRPCAPRDVEGGIAALAATLQSDLGVAFPEPPISAAPRAADHHRARQSRTLAARLPPPSPPPALPPWHAAEASHGDLSMITPTISSWRCLGPASSRKKEPIIYAKRFRIALVAMTADSSTLARLPTCWRCRGARACPCNLAPTLSDAPGAGRRWRRATGPRLPRWISACASAASSAPC